MNVTIPEAKPHFSELLDRVENGEEIVITRGGKPVAKLVGLEPVQLPRQPGSAANDALAVSNDFDAPLSDDVLRDFNS